MGMRLANGKWSDALADTPENQKQYGQGSGYSGGYGYSGPTGGAGGPAPGGGGGGGGGGNSPSTGITNPTNGQPWSFADLQNYFAQTSGMAQKTLDENKRQFDASLAQTIAQMQAIGIPQIEIQKRAQELQDQQFQKQLELATQAQQFQQQVTNAGLTGTYNGAPTEAALEFQKNFGLQQGQLSGTYNGAPTEAAREFDKNLGLQQGQLGLQYATQAANFAASNPFQLSDFMRGAAQNPGVPRYLQNLQNNVVQGSGATVGPDAAPAIRFGDVAGNLAGGGAGYSQTNPAQQAIGGIYQRGANALAPGTLESLTPDELTNLQQGINQGYGSAAGPAFLQSYRNNPVRGQQAAQTGYMAA